MLASSYIQGTQVCLLSFSSSRIVIPLEFNHHCYRLQHLPRYLHCDPITSGLVSTKDQLLPLFVIDILGHVPGFIQLSFNASSFLVVNGILIIRNSGFPGFFVAGVFSGALSTVSGGKQSTISHLINKINQNQPKSSNLSTVSGGK